MHMRHGVGKGTVERRHLELDDVPVLHNVIFPFLPELARRLHRPARPAASALNLARPRPCRSVVGRPLPGAGMALIPPSCTMQSLWELRATPKCWHSLDRPLTFSFIEESARDKGAHAAGARPILPCTDTCTHICVLCSLTGAVGHKGERQELLCRKRGEGLRRREGKAP